MASQSASKTVSKASRFPNDVYHFTNKRWNFAMQSEFLTFYQSEELTDITLKVGGRNFRCHKIILCASSMYFKAMFTSCFSEAAQSEVELRDINASAFSEVLLFFYAGEICITLDNAEDLLNIACMMHLTELKRACSTFLRSYLSLDNCIDQIIFAEKFAVDDLTEACVDLVVTNFHKLVENGGFGQLSAETVVRVLKNDKLPVKNEKEVATAVLNWAGVSSLDRVAQLGFVFSGVRLTELNPKFIKCTLMNNPLIKSDEDLCRKLQAILDNAAYGFPLTKDIKLAHPRVSTGTQQELVIFCESSLDSGASADWQFRLGRSSSGDKLQRLELWRTTHCTRKNHGSTLAILRNGSGRYHSDEERQKVKPYFGMCISDNNLYASGYLDNYSMLQKLTPVTRFDPVQGAYFPCAPLPSKRKSHQLIAGHKGTLYALGGYVYTEPDEPPESSQQQGTPQWRLRKQWCMDVMEYDTAMNKWCKAGGSSQLRLNVRPYYPCFFCGGKLFIVTSHLDIIMFDCESGVNKEIRVTSCEAIRAVFQSHAMVASTVHKDKAIFTSCAGSSLPDGAATFVILNLPKLQDFFENVPPVPAVNPGPGREVDLGDIVESCRAPMSIDGPVDFLALTIFGGDLVAMVTDKKSGDVYAILCDADDMCYGDQRRNVVWKRVHHFRTRHMNEEVKLKNVKRVRMHTLVSNIK